MKSYRRNDHWQQIIKTEVDASEGKLQVVNEMSIPLDKYDNRIESFRFEIVENWCLCKWCQMFSPTNRNFNHWRKKLCTYIKHLKLVTLKNKASKKKHLVDVLVREYDYNDKDMIADIIHDKFNKENTAKHAQIDVVAQEFANGIYELIDVIAVRSLSLDEYIKSTFGV